MLSVITFQILCIQLTATFSLFNLILIIYNIKLIKLFLITISKPSGLFNCHYSVTYKVMNFTNQPLLNKYILKITVV